MYVKSQGSCLIHETVEKCGICQLSSKSSRPVGNVSEVPPHAWHTLGTDLFYWNKIDCLVVGDYFSKYLIVRKLPNSSIHAVIKELGLIFTEFGRPFILRSDNGPCYASRKFHNFLSFYQVDHITSNPHHLQSNGFAEALVGISKKLIEKSVKDGKLWNYGLMQYRIANINKVFVVTFVFDTISYFCDLRLKVFNDFITLSYPAV